ncbi:MAG: hypothetical protein A2474_01250 [Elusimicrobia bacterium RIFOXYC2_FULL_34_12]|nr:MAG: hypothetical protein A2474_01250 [Elusimicrobia bacterium RIFOXYC2_FULL_34_12]
MKKIILLSIICCFTVIESLLGLDIKTVYVTDQRGTIRTNFSDTEKVNLNVSISNTTAIDRISFIFEIYDPSGNKKFSHSGNSIPGSIGDGGSSVRFVPITNFFSSNGTYKLVVFANTTMKEATFTIYAPNLTLTYPSNYARDLTDKPLVFRWVSSGAPKYRIYVDDDAAFFNCIFTDDTMQTQYAYPSEPSDTRQKLAAGTVYYWKIEALDEAGSTIIKTPVPYNFTIKSTAITITAKDIAITDMSLLNNVVVISLKNLGGKSESMIPISLYLNGILQKTINIDNIMQNEVKTVSITPNISGNVVAMATITFDDDNTKNNIYTKQLTITQATVTPSTPTITEKAKILGSVYSSDKSKLKDAIINYDGPIKGTIYANSGGEYKIENLTIGDYKLKASCSGYVSIEQTVKIDKMKSYANIDFYLNATEQTLANVLEKKGGIQGVITDSNGKSMDNTVDVALLIKNAKTNKNEEFAKIKTNNKGQYRFENVSVGEYTLSIFKTDYETFEMSVSIKEGKSETMDIKLAARTKAEVDYTSDVKKCWEIIKTIIKDENIINQINGYEIIKIDTKSDLNKLISSIEKEKAKITSIELVIE